MVGSFLNVVAHRLPLGKSVVLPSSACPACGHRIRAWENIPILSWIALRGRCSACHGGISPRYPLVEVAAAGLAVLAYLHFGWTLHALEASAYLWVLLVLALIDWDTQLLPNRITLPGIGAGLALGALGLLHRDWSLVPLPKAALGAMLGYALIWLPDLLYRRIRHRRGFGIGDRKMLAMVGAWLGPLAVFDVFALAVFAGAILGGCGPRYAAAKSNQPSPSGRFWLSVGRWQCFFIR